MMAYGRDDTIASARDGGAADYTVKPFLALASPVTNSTQSKTVVPSALPTVRVAGPLQPRGDRSLGSVGVGVVGGFRPAWRPLRMPESGLARDSRSYPS